MLHSPLLSGRLEFDPQPQQILFLRKRNLICYVASIAVCTDIHEIWHDCPTVNPLNAELNPICYLLALLGAHHFFHVSRIRVEIINP